MKIYRVLNWVIVLFLVGCAGDEVGPPKPALSKSPPEPVCLAAPATPQLIGQWYFVQQQKGVAGEMQTLMMFAADGKFKQQIRVKQGRNIRSELRETGCWAFDSGVLKTQIVRSNGELVDFNDSIYTLRYRVDSVKGDRLTLRESNSSGPAITAKKMPPSFLLN